MFTSITQIEARNSKIGHCFFSKDSKKFFSSRILSTIYKGVYFITSERNGFDDYSRSFTIRMALNDGSIDTIGGFNRFKTKQQAQKFIKSLPEELPTLINAAKAYWNGDGLNDKLIFTQILAEDGSRYHDLIENNHKDWDLTVLFSYPFKEIYKEELK
jgi:hypothetical protein